MIIEDSAAIVGLAIAFFGTLLDQLLEWHLADGIASVVIGLTLTLVAILLIVESKALVVGEGADLPMLRSIRSLAEAEPGVEVAGYPLTMYFGPKSILLTISIRFAANLDRDGIQTCVDRVEASVRARFPQVHHIYVEAESLTTPKTSDLPSDREEPYFPSLPL